MMLNHAINRISLQGGEGGQVLHSVSGRYSGSEHLMAITMKMMNQVLVIWIIYSEKMPVYKPQLTQLNLQGMVTSSNLGRAVNSLHFLEFAAAP